MEGISRIHFLTELQEQVSKKDPPHSMDKDLGIGYELLHQFTYQKIVPLLQQNKITISVVELTTCGLLSDLLTGSSGASHYFISGIIPYHTKIKIQLGIPSELLLHGDLGTASLEVAEELAKFVQEKHSTTIGLAETGLLPSTELKTRRTKKVTGEVYVAIATQDQIISTQLSLNKALSRLYMRQEIALRILVFLQNFINQNNLS